MNVLVNNKEIQTNCTTLLQLTQELDLSSNGVAIAVNNKMIPRLEWGATTLQEGAAIVIIRAACGG